GNVSTVAPAAATGMAPASVNMTVAIVETANRFKTVPLLWSTCRELDVKPSRRSSPRDVVDERWDGRAVRDEVVEEVEHGVRDPEHENLDQLDDVLEHVDALDDHDADEERAEDRVQDSRHDRPSPIITRPAGLPRDGTSRCRFRTRAYSPASRSLLHQSAGLRDRAQHRRHRGPGTG